MSQQDHRQKQYDKLDKLTTLLDDAFRLPGTDFRFGLDVIMGLIPVVGDTLGAGFSFYIVKQARLWGISRTDQARMVANIVIEWLLGSIPLLGDIFDMAWRANRRNLTILKKHIEAVAENNESPPS